MAKNRKKSPQPLSGPLEAPDTRSSATFRYGRAWPGHTDLDIELICFRDDITPEQGGLGRAEHFWNIVSVLWPSNGPKPFLRHPWAAEMAVAASKHQFLSISGCASSTKTDFCAVWGIVSWLCDPLGTKVMVTSTTLRESRKRIWGSIVDYWNALPSEVSSIGKLVDSYGLIKLSEASGFKSSERCGLDLIPGEKKREKEAVGKIIGVKNRRVILIADELPELSPALVQAVATNLVSNESCQVIGVGNPASYYDAHGLFSCPKNGWDSITPNDFAWETNYGYAIRFDAELSPNILAGEVLYPFLPTLEKMQDAKERLGENSFGYWRMWRGFWCPEGADNTVYSENDIYFYSAHLTKVEWSEPPTPVAGLDAGYTHDGDRSIVYFGLYGNDINLNRPVLLFTDYVLLQDDVTDKKTPRNYQIARGFRQECEKRGVKPQHAALDITGSPAFGDIVAEQWSPSVYRMTFGGKSSLRSTGAGNLPASSLYDNRCTEVWFVLRDFMKNKQIRGIGPDFAKELTSRRFTQSGKKDDQITVTVESKREMKRRVDFSPDIADAGLVLLDLVRTRLGFKVVKSDPVAQHRNHAWKDFVSKQKEKSGVIPGFRRDSDPTQGPRRVRLGRGMGLNLIR